MTSSIQLPMPTTRHVQQHQGAITCLRFSRNGKHLYSASMDRTVRGYDLETNRSWEQKRGKDHSVTHLEICPKTGTMVMRGTGPGLLCLDPGGAEPYYVTEESVTDFGFFPDGELYFLRHDQLFAWNRSRVIPKELQATSLRRVACSPDSKRERFAVIDAWRDTRTIQLYERLSCHSLFTENLGGVFVYDLRFTAGGNFLVARFPNHLRVWSLQESGAASCLPRSFSDFELQSYVITRDERVLIWGGSGGCPSFVDLQQNCPIQIGAFVCSRLVFNSVQGGGRVSITELALSSDERYLAVAVGNEVHLCDFGAPNLGCGMSEEIRPCDRPFC